MMLPPPRELPERAPRLAQGRYVLLARVGRGGMAGVYAAWDTVIDEWRAVKILLPKHARDKSLRNRFEREARTMQALIHPNLVKVYDVGSDDRLPFIVMELISAGSLYRWTKTYGPMPARMAVEATMQLCAGLQLVHEKNVVHRDIKPRNVLINWDGVLKLTDFGIAQLEASHETRTGLAMGTLGFMSPEQLHDAKSVDLRTDIYALGATLWTQLTTRKARDLFRLEDKPNLMDGVPLELRPLLSKCLAYERDDRYSSAIELHGALEELLSILPEDPPDTPPLPLNLGSPSFKSKPENTFSEILTLTRDDETGGSGVDIDEDLKVSRPPAPPRRGPEIPAPVLAAALPTPMASHARRRTDDTQDEESLPSYLVGVDQQPSPPKPELITYQPEAGPSAAPVAGRSRWVTLLLAVLLAPVALALGMGVTLAGAAGWGAMQLGGAAGSYGDARAELVDRVEVSEPMLDEILALGGDPTAARAALDRTRNGATPDDRADAAESFVVEAAKAVEHRLGVGELRPHEETVIKQRLERLASAYTADREMLTEWRRVAESPQGQLAIGLRLADPPPEPDR